MSIQDSTQPECYFTYTLTPQTTSHTSMATSLEVSREIPQLPPEIIENIVGLLLFDINQRNTSNHTISKNDEHDTEYTLLNLFTVFPYLLRQIKTNLCCTYEIPLHIYNFVYMKIDHVFELLVMLVENLKDIYHIDMWLQFITCEHSPFYNTDEGLRFVNYILNHYSNHQSKRISHSLLCNLLEHDIIPKRFDNIIFNKLVHMFKNTSKLNLSLLSNKEKQHLLLFSKARYRNYYPTHEVSEFMITILNLHSTKIIDILAENNYLTNIHDLNKGKITKFILQNYTYDNYLLGLTFQYYLSAVLKTTHAITNTIINTASDNIYEDDNCKNIYLVIISDILANAVLQRNSYVINLILRLNESTKANILHIISNEYFYNTREHFDYLFMYINERYNLIFTDLSVFEWDHTHMNLKKYLSLYTLLESTLDIFSVTENTHHSTKCLLYRIYNYMVYHYNRLHMVLVYNKSYSFKDIDTIDTTVSSYSNSILEKIELLKIKNDVHTLYKYIYKFYYLFNKFNSIMKYAHKYNFDNVNDIINEQNNHNEQNNVTQFQIDKNSKIKKHYIKKIMYLYNIFNFVLKYKLYHDVAINNTVKKTSLRLLEELKTSKFNTLIVESIIMRNYKNTTQNNKLVKHTIKLKDILTLVVLETNVFRVV
jgi:hypothetical protein